MSPLTFWCIITNSHCQNEMHFVPTLWMYGDLIDFCWWRETQSLHLHDLWRVAITCRRAAPLSNWSVCTSPAWNSVFSSTENVSELLSQITHNVFLIKKCLLEFVWVTQNIATTWEEGNQWGDQLGVFMSCLLQLPSLQTCGFEFPGFGHLIITQGNFRHAELLCNWLLISLQKRKMEIHVAQQ